MLEFHVQFDRTTLMLNVSPADTETQTWLLSDNHEAEWKAVLQPLCTEALNQPIESGRPPVLLAARFEHALRQRWPEEKIAVQALSHLPSS